MKRTHRPPLFLMLVAWLLVVPPLFATGQSWELVPLAAIGALTALFWRPIQLWAGRMEHDAAAPPSQPALDRRVTLLEQELASMAREQRQLHDVIHWQEQLLRQGGAPAAKAADGRDGPAALAGE